MNRKINAAQCWYAPEQYDEIKAMMEDGHLLPLAYADWKAGAEQREQQARSHGAAPVRVPFDPAEFRRFCTHFRVPLNTESRQKYAALKAQNSADAH